MHERLRRPVAILCDVGDTLLTEQRFDLRAGIRAVVPDNESQVETLARGFERAERTAHDVHREIMLADWLLDRHAPLDSTPRNVVEDAIWADVVTLTPRDGAVAFLRRLRDDGVGAAAVSNAAFSGRVLGADLDRHGFRGLLQFVISSADLGSRKPAPAIFREALRRLGAAPDRTWFVGDTLAEDVDGAMAVGLTPIWFHGEVTASKRSERVVEVSDWAELLRAYDAT